MNNIDVKENLTFLTEISGDYEKNPREFSQKCEIFRRLSNIKVKAIADELGVSPVTVTRFEKGITRNIAILRYYVNLFGPEVFK